MLEYYKEKGTVKSLLLFVGRVKLAESFPPWIKAVACMIVD
jgi:hypothetical protein